MTVPSATSLPSVRIRTVARAGFSTGLRKASRNLEFDLRKLSRSLVASSARASAGAWSQKAATERRSRPRRVIAALGWGVRVIGLYLAGRRGRWRLLKGGSDSV